MCHVPLWKYRNKKLNIKITKYEGNRIPKPVRDESSSFKSSNLPNNLPSVSLLQR